MLILITPMLIDYVLTYIGITSQYAYETNVWVAYEEKVDNIKLCIVGNESD